MKKDKWPNYVSKGSYAVHATHCCLLHGCKYAYTDCPVLKGKIKQLYLCESCTEYYGITDWNTFDLVKSGKIKRCGECGKLNY